MRSVLCLTLAALLFPLATAAQTAPVETSPAYFAGAGLGFSRASNPQMTGGIVFGMRAANTEGTWAFLEFQNVTAVTSTMQVGVIQQFAKRGNWGLLGIGQGGAATDGQGAITAMFGGGGGPRYHLKGLWSRLDGLSLAAIVRAVKINGADVQLAFNGWLTKSF